MKLATSDIVVIIVYFLVILFVGFKAKQQKETASKTQFILIGRKLTIPFFVASLVATWYGNILGIGEFIYKSGVVAWVCFGLPYYVSAFLFAIFFSKKIRNFGFITIPEQISSKFGNKAGLFSSIVILLITLPAAYVLMLGTIFQVFTGINQSISIIIVTFLSLIYLYWGGFKSDVWTNSVQFVMMYLGFGVLFYFSYDVFGNVETMLSKLPKIHLTFTGDKSYQYIFAWFIISLQTFVDPSFYQRCAASKNDSTAQKGVLISIAFWILFDFLTLVTGLYAKAYLTSIEPMQSYPLLANAVLPTFWKGIFVVSLLSVIMSTLDSYAFISATTIGNDILSKMRLFKEKNSILLIQYGLIITAIGSILLALIIPSAIDIIYKTSSIVIPGLFYPILLTYFTKFTLKERTISFVIILPTILSLFWIILPEMLSNKNSVFLQIEPMIPGLFLSLILGFLFTIRIDNDNN
jgi:SSS family solute:Na+ symporter